ncbi:excinuclease ABC subunit UvrC [candidate division WOR-3 bacterium]|nr:excinuclease ABC subunit UvrC [candidate division WOR-3 bacterium]
MPAPSVNYIPQKPGVYLMKDKNGKIIYVGKAKSLKDRVRSYFTTPYSPKERALKSKIESVDYIVTNSEIEALVLEANLIKLHLPYYNIRLKDDKKYPYIKVTTQEAFPRVFPTRDLRNRSAIYFGPYTNARTMKRALRSATNIFPIRICKGKLPSRACLAYHIGKCPAPCENKISKEEYGDIIQELIAFLSGRSKEVEKKLKAKMQELSEKLKFEDAAKVRDQLKSVQFIARKQRVVFNRPISLDTFGLQRKRNTACIVLVLVREGRILGTEHYILHIQSKASDGEIMRAFLLQYYKNAFYIPREIVIRKVDEKETIEKWFARPDTKQVGKRKILVPKRGEKFGLIKFAEQNALVWLETEQEEKIPKVLDELKKYLKLPKLPSRIEAFDISNIGGKYAVGSCVSFLNGRAQKSGYRRFKIQTVDEIDDVGMMREILSRRASADEHSKHKKFPDLVLVDGGIGQTRAARESMPSEIPVFGLAKRFEELHTPDGKIISLPKSSIALRLLQRIRNEAHRFAISYHRKLRDKPKSLLNEIPGIGKQRRELLLKHFSSFKELKQASISEIEDVPGIGKTRAKEIYNFLRLI